MANPNKLDLSRTLADMKFMKRRSSGAISDNTPGGALIDKWFAPNVPELLERPKWPEVQTSYVEFEELNTLGRFSYNKFNKDIERLMEAYHRTVHKDDLSDGELEEEEEDSSTVKVAEVVDRYERLGMSGGKRLGKRRRQN